MLNVAPETLPIACNEMTLILDYYQQSCFEPRGTGAIRSVTTLPLGVSACVRTGATPASAPGGPKLLPRLRAGPCGRLSR